VIVVAEKLGNVRIMLNDGYCSWMSKC
jgi:hypothetical protein